MLFVYINKQHEEWVFGAKTKKTGKAGFAG